VLQIKQSESFNQALRDKSAMDGWIQNNWLEAAVVWWLTAEASHDKSADYYAIPGLQFRYK